MWGDFSNDGETSKWANITITYATSPSIAASFEFELSTSSIHGRSSIQSRGLSRIFAMLSRDLKLPVTHSAAVEALETSRAQRQAESRAALAQETIGAPDAREAHHQLSTCTEACEECASLDVLDAALRIKMDSGSQAGFHRRRPTNQGRGAA